MLGSSFPTVGGATLPEDKAAPRRRGATFTNAFIHVPICNPSRSTTLTGRYFHNLRTANRPGPPCVNMDACTTGASASSSSARATRRRSWAKYVNAMPGGYVPQGWSAYLAERGGDYAGPKFVARNAPGIPDGAYAAPRTPTRCPSSQRVRGLPREAPVKSEPVLLYCAPKAVHEFNPPPWYADHWDELAGETLFTSDHGFQLSQLNMLMDKRHVYDWDTRVPLVIKGPASAGDDAGAACP
ncbi:sulfuric ester hydrolase [Aureococcus anophagefferens]|nr:sulfuric ester hydrolase [Aureococcus anophagefferens]